MVGAQDAILAADEKAERRVAHMDTLCTLINKKHNPKQEKHKVAFGQNANAQEKYERKRENVVAQAGKNAASLLGRMGPITFDFSVGTDDECQRRKDLWAAGLAAAAKAPADMPLTVGSNAAAMVVRPSHGNGGLARWEGSQPVRVLNNGVWRNVEVQVTVFERVAAGDGKGVAPATSKANNKKKKNKGAAKGKQGQQQQQQQAQAAKKAVKNKNRPYIAPPPAYDDYRRNNDDEQGRADRANPWEHDRYDGRYSPRSPRNGYDDYSARYARSPGYGYGNGYHSPRGYGAGYPRSPVYGYDHGYGYGPPRTPRGVIDYDVEMAEPSPARSYTRSYTPERTYTARGAGAVHPSRMGMVPGTTEGRGREHSRGPDGRGTLASISEEHGRVNGVPEHRNAHAEREVRNHDHHYSPSLRSPSPDFGRNRDREASEELRDVPDSPATVYARAPDDANVVKRKRTVTPELDLETDKENSRPAHTAIKTEGVKEDRPIKKLRTACRV